MQLPVAKKTVDLEMFLVFLLIANEIEELLSKRDSQDEPQDEPPGEE